ncbi:molybdenum cofactor guanylyltransferase [Bacillus aquiflavi]|uniref:molybdenum cofactor guanylyltransferase n=1 Tax=Bacillus aquiflavi TaxID=2672567 RepID=UPI001CAA0035|nr:molybdenum cofactor guanylyltransferase [Bacillus aquiflavi]UAC47977.1 molybdenum cofactor guanylyltransferase [Bacillus aquiflavi]
MGATCIILAGGKSSRMGTNKALLKIEGITVIERMINELTKIVKHVLVVTNQFDDYSFINVPLVEDHYKGKGPLAGIQAGLNAVKTEKNMIVACDLPFVSSRLAKELLVELDKYDAVVPEINGQLHPLFGAYHKDCLQVVNRLLDSVQLKIRQLLNQVHVKIKTSEDFAKFSASYMNIALYNMNNRQEYEEAVKLVKDHVTKT